MDLNVAMRNSCLHRHSYIWHTHDLPRLGEAYPEFLASDAGSGSCKALRGRPWQTIQTENDR